MFMPTNEDARVAESAIVAFCTALNTPVVDIEGLGNAPARAGILLSTSQYGALDLWVRVRTISSGQGVTFKFQGDPADLGDPTAALAAALSFSEGMGFLFANDMIGEAGIAESGRAHRAWASLFESGGNGQPEPPPVVEPVAPVLEAEPAGEPAPQSREPAASGHPVMTKFRDAEPAAAVHPIRRKPGERELARIELASEEIGGEYVDHAGFLSRLLGSF